MKKIILLLLLVPFMSTSIMAQGPVNGDFEDWYQTEFQHQNPDFWITSTDFIGSPTNAEKDSETKYSGSFSAKLRTVNVFGGGTAPGVLALASRPNEFSQEFIFGPGDSMTYRPDSIAGFYRYSPLGNEQFYVYMMLTKWNGTSRDTIGGGGYSDTTTRNEFYKFAGKIHYVSNAYPDSVQIIISTAKDYTAGVEGTEAYVDSVHFIGTNTPTIDINKIDRVSKVVLYPNPSKNNIKLEGLQNRMDYTICDVLGHKLISGRDLFNGIEIDISSLTPGVYYLYGDDFKKKFTVL